MNVDQYLERIGYSGPTTPTVDTLRDLHRAHLFHVPFENLDIGWKRQIRVDQEAFVSKIVDERRGGFCYELNGGFAALLTALGFRVSYLSARVPRADGSAGPEFDHLTLRVDLDEPWLADVGFGDCFLDPLLLKTGLEQQQYRKCFRIAELDSRLVLASKEAKWKTEYVFDLRPRKLEDFREMCEFHQTSPSSPFTQKRLCSVATPDGRLTLSEMKLIITRGESRQEDSLESEQEWTDVLRRRFGVVRPET